MRLLAVDTSCDDSCAAVIDTESFRLLGESVYSHAAQMAAYGGIVPELASREHLRGLPLAVQEALRKSELSIQDIDWFAVTHRPGLIGALLVGVSYVKGLAFSCRKPFSAMNHIESHLYSPWLSAAENSPPPPYPWIALVVSGGHTELFYVESNLKCIWLGGTLDDAAGEAFDKIGKLIGLSYPAGPQIDKLVRENASLKDFSAFSFPRAKTEAFSFSFSGLKTAVALEVQKHQNISKTLQLALAASAQEAILDALLLKLREAQRAFPGTSLVVTGGVACNSRLRSKLDSAYFPLPRHCTDNAAMVAVLAALKHREGMLQPSLLETGAFPSMEFV